MSDTDDTDVLILIPPDFFMVNSSDSEDSVDIYPLRNRFSNSCGHSIERVHVDDLFHQVNHLESRISLIESKENLEKKYLSQQGFYKQLSEANISLPVSYQDEYAPKYSLMPERFSSTLDNVRYQAPNSTPSTPIKSNGHHLNNSFHSLRSPFHPGSQAKDNTVQSYNSVSTGPLSLSADSIMQGPPVYHKPFGSSTTDRQGVTHSSGDGSQPNQYQNKNDLIQEIDSFLDSVKKNPQSLNHHPLVTERNRREKWYQCGDNVGSIPDLGYGLRDLNSLPVREEPVVSKYFAPLEPKSASSTSNRMSLPEVDKLLEEMESTQMLMEQKLRMKEAQFGKGQAKSHDARISFPDRSPSCGENIGSIPDLGFGIRQAMANPTDNGSQSSRKPVNEPKVLKRSMSLCGVNPTEQSGKNPNTNANKGRDGPHVGTTGSRQVPANRDGDTDPNIPKVFVPRRLELGGDSGSVPDLGFGLKEWYKSIESDTNNAQQAATRSNTVVKEGAPQSSNKYIQGGLPSSIPDLGFGLRDLWSSSDTQQVSSTGSSTEPHQAGVSKDINKHTVGGQSRNNPGIVEGPSVQKSVLPSQSGIRDSVVLDQEYGSNNALSLTTSANFPSLSGLWSKQLVASDLDTENDLNILKHKLGEERYRRQHCEQLIQKLQIGLLEEQQKLAVAIQVDSGKDRAIQHFQSAWVRLVGHWKELEEQRHNLAIQREAEQEQHQQRMSDTLHKIKRYESEMSKALDLAQGYKEKSEDVERDKQNLAERLQYEIQALHNKLKEKDEAVVQEQRELNKVLNEKEEMSRKLATMEEDTKKDKSVLLAAKKELDKKSKVINGFEADLAALKEEKATLQLTLKEEKGRTHVLEQHKKSLQGALDESKKKEKSLREEVKDSTSQMDKLKIELRDFYQEQVDIVVRDKLREFQNQLDTAEKSLRGELDDREQAINEIAVMQIKQISEKHQLEVKLLEEKHKEELQLCQLKLAQAKEQISRLEAKLKSYNSRKGEIVEKLHGVMENQWQQALKIINGHSPSMTRLYAKLENNGMDSTNDSWPLSQTASNSSVRANTEELKHLHQSSLASQKIPSLQLPLHSDRSSSTTNDFPFSKDGQVTQRITQEKSGNNAQLSEIELKKYIEMLLNRSPGNPIPDDKTSSGQWQTSSHASKDGKQQQTKEMLTTDVNQLPRWENVDRLNSQSRLKQAQSDIQFPLTASIPEFDMSKLSHNSVSMEPKTGKPPWK